MKLHFWEVHFHIWNRDEQMGRRKENRTARKRSQRKNSLRVSARAGQILASNIYGKSFNQGPQASFKVFIPFFIHSLKKFTSWTWFIMIRSLCKTYSLEQEAFIFGKNQTFVKAMGMLLWVSEILRFPPRCLLADFKARTINSTGIRNSKPFIIFHGMRQLLKQNPFSKLHWITWALKSYSRLRRNSMQQLFLWTKLMEYCKKPEKALPGPILHTHINTLILFFLPFPCSELWFRTLLPISELKIRPDCRAVIQGTVCGFCLKTWARDSQFSHLLQTQAFSHQVLTHCQLHETLQMYIQDWKFNFLWYNF